MPEGYGEKSFDMGKLQVIDIRMHLVSKILTYCLVLKEDLPPRACYAADSESPVLDATMTEDEIDASRMENI